MDAGRRPRRRLCIYDFFCLRGVSSDSALLGEGQSPTGEKCMQRHQYATHGSKLPHGRCRKASWPQEHGTVGNCLRSCENLMLKLTTRGLHDSTPCTRGSFGCHRGDVCGRRGVSAPRRLREAIQVCAKQFARDVYSVHSLSPEPRRRTLRFRALPRCGEAWLPESATLVLRTSAAKTRRIMNASEGSVIITAEN